MTEETISERANRRATEVAAARGVPKDDFINALGPAADAKMRDADPVDIAALAASGRRVVSIEERSRLTNRELNGKKLHPST